MLFLRKISNLKLLSAVLSACIITTFFTDNKLYAGQCGQFQKNKFLVYVITCFKKNKRMIGAGIGIASTLFVYTILNRTVFSPSKVKKPHEKKINKASELHPLWNKQAGKVKRERGG